MSKLCPKKVGQLPPKTKNFLFFLEKINFLKIFLSTQIELIWQPSRKSCRSKSKITSGAIIFAPNVKILSKKRFEGTAYFPKKLSSFWQSKSWRKGRKFSTASQLSCRNWPSHISSQKNQRGKTFSRDLGLFLFTSQLQGFQEKNWKQRRISKFIVRCHAK